MKVLISAYGCEPNRGSEPGIGWHWALETARLGHEVWVLTRANNRETIEAELAKSPPIKNLHFLYYDLPLWVRWWKKGNRRVHLYYFFWQWGAYLLAKRVHKAERFERVQHVTFSSIILPIFMGNLKIPFVFGPVGGGDRAPWRLRMRYSWRGWIKDGVRDLAISLIRINPIILRSFKQAERIYVTSEATLSLLPRKYRQKAVVQLSIAFSSEEMLRLPEKPPSDPINNNHVKVLYGGRLVYWKGMDLGLPAFAQLQREVPDARLTIVGKGPDEQRLRTLAQKLGVADQIDWIPWVDRKELPVIFTSHDVCLFPSLHESGGMVALEAMSHSLPVVCFAIGGPATTVNETCGLKVETKGLSADQAILAMADCMIQLARDPLWLHRLSKGAAKRAKEFSWPSLVARLYSECNNSD
jgi:glycosyltransferase involved in cell wall biosynthesis